MKAYIISYFGSREQLLTRAKRYLNHNKQVKWWHKIDPSLKIVILAMDYDPHEYLDENYVEYIKHPVVGPAAARNILLNLFYNSQDSWALFLDNDAILKHHQIWPHTHFNINNFIRNNITLFKDITIFMPHCDIIPGDGAFTKKYNNSDPNYANIKWSSELCFDRMFMTLKGTLFYLQNHKQHIYMDENIFPAEDHEFALHHYLKGYKSYRLRNIMLYEYPSPSTWVKSKIDRGPQIEESYSNMSKKWGLPERRKWLRHITNNLNIDHPKRILLPY